MNVPQFSASGAFAGVDASMQELSVHGIYTILEQETARGRAREREQEREKGERKRERGGEGTKSLRVHVGSCLFLCLLKQF